MSNENQGIYKKRELKLIYKGSKLERIELEGKTLESFMALTEGPNVPTLEEITKRYELKYEYLK